MATKDEVAVYRQVKALVESSMTPAPTAAQVKLLGAIAILMLWEFKRNRQVFVEGDTETPTTWQFP